MPAGGFSNPERIIKELNLPEGTRVADFGSGSGYFTLLLAKAVGPEGLVTAVDVLPAPLEVIKTRAGDAGLFNIAYVRGNLEVLGGSQLTDDSQDLVLLANILFQSQKKADIIRETKRVLKTDGELVVIDWTPQAVFGPAEAGWKLSKEEGQKLAEAAGFALVREIAVSQNHWGLIFKK